MHASQKMCPQGRVSGVRGGSAGPAADPGAEGAEGAAGSGAGTPPAVLALPVPPAVLPSPTPLEPEAWPPSRGVFSVADSEGPASCSGWAVGWVVGWLRHAGEREANQAFRSCCCCSPCVHSSALDHEGRQSKGHAVHSGEQHEGGRGCACLPAHLSQLQLLTRQEASQTPLGRWGRR